MHLVGFLCELYYDATIRELQTQKGSEVLSASFCKWNGEREKPAVMV